MSVGTISIIFFSLFILQTKSVNYQDLTGTWVNISYESDTLIFEPVNQNTSLLMYNPDKSQMFSFGIDSSGILTQPGFFVYWGGSFRNLMLSSADTLVVYTEGYREVEWTYMRIKN